MSVMYERDMSESVLAREVVCDDSSRKCKLCCQSVILRVGHLRFLFSRSCEWQGPAFWPHSAMCLRGLRECMCACINAWASVCHRCFYTTIAHVCHRWTPKLARQHKFRKNNIAMSVYLRIFLSLFFHAVHLLGCHLEKIFFRFLQRGGLLSLRGHVLRRFVEKWIESKVSQN